MHVRGSIITSFVEMQRRTGQLVDKRGLSKSWSQNILQVSRCRDVTWQKCHHHIFLGNPLSWRKWQETFIEATCIDFVFSQALVKQILESILLVDTLTTFHPSTSLRLAKLFCKRRTSLLATAEIFVLVTILLLVVNCYILYYG